MGVGDSIGFDCSASEDVLRRISGFGSVTFGISEYDRTFFTLPLPEGFSLTGTPDSSSEDDTPVKSRLHAFFLVDGASGAVVDGSGEGAVSWDWLYCAAGGCTWLGLVTAGGGSSGFFEGVSATENCGEMGDFLRGLSFTGETGGAERDSAEDVSRLRTGRRICRG
jgi:hypothetical protein